MKPRLLILILLSLQSFSLFAQSLDYISVRKNNSRAIKNFYTGSAILLQTNDGAYVQGPVEAIRHDSIFIRVYDVRLYRTTFGSVIRDTVTSWLIQLHYKDIKRVHLAIKQGFFQRQTGPILLLGGGGYLAVNLLNGAFFNQPITDKANVKRLITAGSLLGLGFLFTKLFASDGFSKNKHRIVYVDL